MKNWMIILSSVLILGAFAACKSTSQSVKGRGVDTRLDTTWTLQYIDGPRIAFKGLFPKKAPFIHFETDKNHVDGFAGCNNFMGPAIAKKDSIHFGNLASTLMACLDGGQGEALFLRVLPTTETYKINGDTLWLQKSGHTILQFIRGK